MWSFLLWSAVCVAGSTDAAGQAGGAAVSGLLGLLGATAHAQMIAALFQKAAHVGLFGVLGLLAASEPVPARRKWYLVAGAVICIVAEALQGLMATRHPAVGDALLNLAAFGAMVVLSGLWSRRAAADPDVPS